MQRLFLFAPPNFSSIENPLKETQQGGEGESSTSTSKVFAKKIQTVNTTNIYRDSNIFFEKVNVLYSFRSLIRSFFYLKK